MQMSKAKFVHARGEKSHFEKELLLTMVKHLGLINEGSSVDLDFDHQFIPAHKYDATYSYKGDYGYFQVGHTCLSPFLSRTPSLCSLQQCRRTSTSFSLINCLNK